MSRRPAADSPSLHAFSDSAPFARRLARRLGAAVHPLRLHRFPDGESLVCVRAPVRGDACLVRSLHDPNTKLIEVLLAADALRRAGARTVTLVAPYLAYMRQDEVFAPGQPISQRVVGRALGEAFDAVLTLEAHLHRVRRLEDVAGRASRSLSAAPAIAAWLGRDRGDAVVVGPDEESSPWVRAIAEAAGVPWVLGHKRRHGDRRVAIELPAVPRGVRAVIVDDIASSGGTIATTARALRRRGVSVVDAVVVHAIFATGAVGAIRAAGVRRLVSCDTIPHRTNAIATAELFAAALNGASGGAPRAGGRRHGARP